MREETIVNKLEKGRAEFAYKCATEGKLIANKFIINGEYYKDTRYKSYVKRIPTMILSNGLGQTLSFILSKRQKEKKGERPGTENNPKNAYDLIYDQLTRYMQKSGCTSRIQMPAEETELVGWVISCDSPRYRHITQEILALLCWLRRFAEGLMEDVEEE